MKIAIVHDWLTGMRGGERCLSVFLGMYPGADIFTLLHVPGATSAQIDSRVKRTSFLQRLPGARFYYRLLLPLFPLAAGRFDFRGYDLVISLSHAAAKNVRVPPEIPHVCYCFSPMRYIWDQARHYFGFLTPVLWPIIVLLRRWDVRGGRRPHVMAVISRFVAARVRCFYGRPAELLYPPVDTSWISPLNPPRPGAAFLLAGALVPYKKAEIAIEAFNRLGFDLWVAGSGPLLAKLKARAGPNIHFFGHVSDFELAGLYRKCRALVFPGSEDFGMVPIECLAAGRPVIGLCHGALRETLKAWPPGGNGVSSGAGAALQGHRVDAGGVCGVFIRRVSGPGSEARVMALMEGVCRFIEAEKEISARSCVERARVFGVDRFVGQWNRMLLRHGLGEFQCMDAEHEGRLRVGAGAVPL